MTPVAPDGQASAAPADLPNSHTARQLQSGMNIVPTLRQRFLTRPALALQWQLALVCSGLAAVLVLTMLTLTERLVVAHAELAAQAQADDVASNLADMYSRALERRLTELKMLSHSTALADLGNAGAMRAELQWLSTMAPIYRSMVVLDPAARVLGSTHPAQPPGAVLPGLLPLPLPTAPWFSHQRSSSSSNGNPGNPGNTSNTGKLPPGASSVRLGVPFYDTADRLRGFVLAELDLNWFRGLRDEIVARPDNTTVLSVALFGRDGQPLINDHPELDALALQAYHTRPEGDLMGHLRHGPGGKQVLVSYSSLRPNIDLGGLGWQVVVAQDLDAAQAPAKNLQRAVVLTGTGLAVVFAALVYLLVRRAVQPYARLLAAVTKRFWTDQGHTTGLTHYLDAASAQVKRMALPVPPPGGRLPANSWPPQALAVVDVLALVAADASQLQQLLDLLPIGMLVLDGDMCVRYCNRRCEAIFDIKAAEMVGLMPWQTMGMHLSPQQVAESRQRMQERTTPYTVTHEHQRPDGALFLCEWVVSPERDAHGQLVRTLALVHDVTEQRAAEATRARQASDISALARQLLDHEGQVTQRLAQTLHDRLGQTLTALRLAFDALDTHAANGVPAAEWAASPIGALLDQAVRDVREALVELHPPLLDAHGLHATLDNEIRNLWRQPTGVRITLTSDDETTWQRYPVEVEYAAFMVAREAISNALQHAKPHHISVHLSGVAGALLVEIKDDGSGFDARNALPPPGHLGLVGMRERALAVGAVLSVRSLPGVGSCARFEWLGPPPAQPQDSP